MHLTEKRQGVESRGEERRKKKYISESNENNRGFTRAADVAYYRRPDNDSTDHPSRARHPYRPAGISPAVRNGIPDAVLLLLLLPPPPTDLPLQQPAVVDLPYGKPKEKEKLCSLCRDLPVEAPSCLVVFPRNSSF